MGASLNPSGGHFFNSVVLNWELSPDVAYINFTTDGIQPTISTYIAYDTLTPPNPFIAVTQDGNGNVVYDGGFPKLYNSYAPPVGTTFSQFSGAFKYFHNAINFVANKAKVAKGNKKMLIIGDANSGEGYNIMDGAVSDFHYSFQRLAASTGFVPTFKTRSGWGGVINPTLAELEQYALVIYMSSAGNKTLISDAAVNNMVTYRENGNGLIFITDHGPVLNTIGEAISNDSGFFATANKVIANFGAWFSGDFDRTPVNVGHIRRTYGDHPLYNGMLDSDDISAGGSESKVNVAVYTPYTAANVPPITLSTNGVHIISVLVIMKDGSMHSDRYAYTVIDGDIYRYKNIDGVVATETKATLHPMVSFSVDVVSSAFGTLRGGVYKNKKIVGLFDYDAGVSKITWFAGGNETVATTDGDIIEVMISTPFNYAKPLLVKRIGVSVDGAMSEAVLARRLFDNKLSDSVNEAVTKVRALVKNNIPNVAFTNDISGSVRITELRRFFGNNLNLPPATAYIYKTDVAMNSGLLVQPTTDVAISAATNTVKYYQNERWIVAEGVTPSDFLGYPRQVTSSVDGVVYNLYADGIK